MVFRRARADDPQPFDADGEDPGEEPEARRPGDRERDDPDGNHRGGGFRGQRHGPGCLPWLIASLALLGGGFYWGYQFRAAQRLSAEELQLREREELRTMGWQTSADGVLTRWCTDDCHPPRLYGGGMARIFEVYCKDRPCGAIRASFRVLDRDGKEVGTTTASKDGLQGERLRLAVVSPEPRAQRFELKEFTAQAMVY